MKSATASYDVGEQAKSLSDRRPRWPACGVLLLAMFLPLFDTIGIGPVVMIAATICLTLTTPQLGRVRLSAFALSVFALCVVVAGWVGYQNGNGNFYYDLAVVGVGIPAGYFMGVRIGFHEQIVVQFLRVLLFLVVAASLLAIFETLRGQYIFGNSLFSNTPDRNGQLRGRAFFPQSLVLAVFCAAAIPLVLSCRVVGGRTLTRIPLICVLAGGVYSSGSRGVAVCLMVALAMYFMCKLGSSRALTVVWCTMVVLLGFVILLIVAGNPFAAADVSLVTSSDGATASAQYRAELYRQILPVVADNTWGSGFGRVPEGVISFDSSYGLLDASRTVDSELVLVLLKFGVLGGLLYVMLWAKAIRCIVNLGNEIAFALSIFLFAGVFLALESWLSLAAVISVFVGLLAAADVRQRVELMA